MNSSSNTARWCPLRVAGYGKGVRLWCAFAGVYSAGHEENNKRSENRKAVLITGWVLPSNGEALLSEFARTSA